jgi:hypothetical protein
LTEQVEAAESLSRLMSWIEAEGFRGYDPYDALNSPFIRVASLGLKYPRIAATQLLKVLPFNIRPLLGIRKDYNPKGLGLFLWGYGRLYALEGRPEHLQTAERLLDLLEDCRSRGGSGNSWGYNFPWQSRSFSLPRWTPTIVNSAFIGHALIDAWRHTELKRALDLALPIAEFILRDLNRTGSEDEFCFSYTPLDHTVIHNASLLGASFLARIHGITGDNEQRTAALAALRWSMRRQQADGSWLHAETNYQRWIDSFHTGFNLQSLLYFLQEGYWEEARDGFIRGTDFYQKHFFLEDGTPKYYQDRVWPIDIHAPSQAVVFFSMMGGRYRDFAGHLLSWMIRRMQDEEGYFHFQITPRGTNRIPYMRWSQAWAFNALTAYSYSMKSGDEEVKMP